MKLSTFSSSGFDRGRSAIVEGLWLVGRSIAFAHFNPLNASRVALLRIFGARIGRGVIVKPGVKVKFPWRFVVGDHSWIGEDVWVDNLAEVTIGSDSVVSQGAYLCTGNHDWSKESFDLQARPIAIGSQVWVAAKVSVGPGVAIGDGAVVSMGTVLTRSVPADHLCEAATPVFRPKRK